MDVCGCVDVLCECCVNVVNVLCECVVDVCDYV